MINECNKIYKKKFKNKNIFNKLIKETPDYGSDNSIQNSNSKIDFELMIDKLSYDEKLIVTLYYNSNYSCNEIADILNMNANTVKSKLLRTKDKIKKYYKGGIYNG